MIHNRRTFLRASLGIGAAAGGLCHHAAAAPVFPAGPVVGERDNFERTLAASRYLDGLGRPRSWSIVRQGFLPISPERVLRFEPHGGRGNPWIRSLGLEPSHIRDRLIRDACQSDYHRRAAEGNLSDEKLGLIIRITDELVRFYAVPEYWEDWAFGMTMRESLGSTWIWRHAATPHQWQHCPTTGTAKAIQTANASVDWWLILIPSGTLDWNPCDGEPTYVMFTHVLSHSYTDPMMPRAYLMMIALLGAGLRSLLATSPHALVELSQMDRVSAARLMNQHVLLGLRDLEK